MDLPESHATSSYVWNQDPEFTIQSIKPVFMMSPLSIAKYIPPGSVDFDLVVFDEASRTADLESILGMFCAQGARSSSNLAVVDPERPGRHLLGIECDGATYHSSRSARDRDRLGQQVPSASSASRDPAQRSSNASGRY